MSEQLRRKQRKKERMKEIKKERRKEWGGREEATTLLLRKGNRKLGVVYDALVLLVPSSGRDGGSSVVTRVASWYVYVSSVVGTSVGTATSNK
jgi:hypothetical protein